MIEVNLLPGGKKRTGRPGGFKLPKLDMEGLPSDPWVLGSGGIVLALILVGGFLYFSRSDTYEELETAVETAAADSARYADVIEQAERLRARRDSVAERVEIIQEIDRDRYVWPHIIDEVARALPEYTWITGLVQTSLAEDLQMRIDGRAGTNFALTTFMESLEASPYVRNVTLVNTQLVVESQGGVSRSVNSFTLDATFEESPMEMRETVPLFDQGPPPPVQSQPQGAATPGGAGASPSTEPGSGDAAGSTAG